MCFSKKEAKYATGRGRKSFSYQWEQLTLDPSEQSDRVVNKISTHVNIMSNVFLVLTQAFTKDKPSTILFYFHQSLVHNMFRLAPWSHGILLTTEWKSHKSQKKTFVMTTFTLSHKVQCYQSQMEWEKVKNFHPSGVVFSPPSPPRFSLASVVLKTD